MELEYTDLDDYDKFLSDFIQRQPPEHFVNKHKVLLKCDGCSKNIARIVFVGQGPHFVFYEGLGPDNTILYCDQCKGGQKQDGT
jgi:hypothetical protein